MVADGQLELRVGDAAALVVGAGTSYRFTVDWVAWWTSPALRNSDYPRSGAHGSVPGRDLMTKHSTPIVVQILGDSASDLGDKVDAWKAATAVSTDTEVEITANLLGRTRTRFGRFRYSEVLPRGAVTNAGHIMNGAAQFEALDPRTYAGTTQSVSTARQTPGAGLAVPWTPPLTFPSSVSGAASVPNGGNTEAPWTAVLTGPLTYPEVSHLESGRRLSLDFTANGGVDLEAGETLVLDSDARSVLLNGLSDRRSQLTVDSEWFSLQPGANTVSLAADAGAGTLAITWRDTFWS